MAFTISYPALMMVITGIWILVRLFVLIRNHSIDWKYECKLLTVYACIAIVTRLVYFPLLESDGREKILIYSTKFIRNKTNLIPFAYLKYSVRDWIINVLGNIVLFVPVGTSWPLCFNKLNKIWKVVLAGAGYSLLIELSQMFVAMRETDIDDLITNTLGTLIGAFIFFKIQAIRKSHNMLLKMD